MEFEKKQTLTRVFRELSENPLLISDRQMTIIEEYLCYVYYPNVTAPVDIDALRMRDFEHSAHNNLRFLPPSKNGLLQHCRRAGYEAGWVQRQCLEDVDLPDPLMWGWSKINDEFVPK